MLDLPLLTPKRPTSPPRWLPFAGHKNSSRAAKRTLFIDPRKLSAEVEAYLRALDLEIQPYDDVWTFLSEVVKKDFIKTEEKQSVRRVFTGLSISWAVQLALGKVCSP